jgi:hypothetical protein
MFHFAHHPMNTSPFSLRQIQTLDIQASHKPNVDIKGERLVITAQIDGVDTVITVPVDQNLPAQAKKSAIRVKVKKDGRSNNRVTTKLNADQVREIRQLLRDETYAELLGSRNAMYKEIGACYNVSASCIMAIDNKYTWKHIN